MPFDWDPFKGGSGEFAKFENVGDEVVGCIVAIRTHVFKEEKGPVPLIDLERQDSGEPVTLAVDKVDLVIKIADLAPQVGDMLAVKFVSTEKTPNGTKKVFAVKHKEGERVEFPEPREEFSDDPF